MKILHVIKTIDPVHGGPAVSAPSLAAAQAKQHHQVSLAFMYSKDQKKGIEKTKNNIPYFNGIELVLIPNKGIKDKVLAISAVKPLLNEIRKADIVHMHGVWDPIVLLSAVIALIFNKPYVFSPRGMLDPWSLSQKKWKKKIMLTFFSRYLLNKSLFIHCLNETEKTLIKPLGLQCELRVFPNGIFPEKIKDNVDKNIFFDSFSQLKNKPFILFLSRLHYKKGLDILIDCFAQVTSQIDNLNLVVAGNDDGELENLERKIKENNLDSKVHFIGPIYGDLKYSALKNAECFVLPSRQEGFSMAITEAMAYGCAVIVSEECHFPEVSEYNAGYVVSLNADAFSQAIVTLVKNTELKNSFIYSAKNIVTSMFSWHRIAEEIILAYQVKKGSREALN